MNKKGLTIIELLISVFILSVMLTGIVAVLSVGDRVWRSNMTLVELQQQLRGVMRGNGYGTAAEQSG